MPNLYNLVFLTCSSVGSTGRRLLAGFDASIQGHTDRSPKNRDAFLIHFSEAIVPQTVKQLETALKASDAVLGNYLPQDSYIVYAPRLSLPALRVLPGASITNAITIMRMHFI